MSLDANGVTNPAAPAAQTAAPAAPTQAVPNVPNPHPAAVQPAPANAAPLTVNYNVQAPTPAAPAGQPNQAAASPTSAAAVPTIQATGPISLSPDQFQQLLTAQVELTQIRANEEAQRVAREREQAEARARQGQLEEGLTLLRQQSEQQLNAERQRLQQIEQRAQRYALDGELSRALASHSLVQGGAEQLTQLWRNQFVVDAQGDSFSVRTPTFQSVGEFVSQQLARPEYAHFVRAQNPGGGTATGQTPQAAQTPPAQPTPAPQARNMGEAVILHMQNLEKTQGDARVNMGLGFGLKPAAGAR